MSYFRTMRTIVFLSIFLLFISSASYAAITDQPQAYEADREVTINFKGLKISDLIDITSKLLNRNILLTKTIGGTVDFIANRPLTQSDALDILMYTLEAKGYTIVDSGNMLRVIKISDASKYNIPIQKNDVKYPKQELVTQMFSVENANVDYIASKVRHFMSRSAKLVTDKETNSMILTDFASNIKTVQIAIAIISSDNKKIIKIIPLKNIKAQNIEAELNKVAKAVFNTKIGKEKVTILANKDTNSIMLVGNLKNVQYMTNYLMNIENSGSLAEKVVELVSLKNGDAANVFKVIGGIIGSKKYKNPDDKPFISLDDDANSIIIRGSKSEIKFIKSMIADLDVDKQQVYVKVKIIEVSAKKSRDVGIKYGLIAGKTTSSGLGTLSANLGGDAIAFSPTSIGVSVPTGLTEGLALGTTLNLLQTNGAAELLSSPLLLCINNKESSIYAGSTKTIKTGSATSTGGIVSDKYAREDIGLTLKIKPRISTGNKVRLDISLILEDVEATTTNDQPDTSKKEISTTAIVNDGENVILGGYTREKEDELITKVPFLGDIPWIGALFRSKSIVTDKIDLVVIITPYIVPKTKDLTFIRNKLARLKLLEDRYSQVTLLRLEQQRVKNQELELDIKDEMIDTADTLQDNNEDIQKLDEELQEYLNDMENYAPEDKRNLEVMFGLKDKNNVVDVKSSNPQASQNNELKQITPISNNIEPQNNELEKITPISNNIEPQNNELEKITPISNDIEPDGIEIYETVSESKPIQEVDNIQNNNMVNDDLILEPENITPAEEELLNDIKPPKEMPNSQNYTVDKLISNVLAPVQDDNITPATPQLNQTPAVPATPQAKANITPVIPVVPQLNQTPVVPQLNQTPVVLATPQAKANITPVTPQTSINGSDINKKNPPSNDVGNKNSLILEEILSSQPQTNKTPNDNLINNLINGSGANNLASANQTPQTPSKPNAPNTPNVSSVGAKNTATAKTNKPKNISILNVVPSVK